MAWHNQKMQVKKRFWSQQALLLTNKGIPMKT
jgi:hypothetical protein